MYFLKCIYQTFKIRLTLFLCKYLSKSFSDKSVVVSNLKRREFDWNKNSDVKVFAIFSINNWEKVLVDELSSIGEVTHFNWENISSFFPSKKAWERHMTELNSKLIKAFDSFYNSTDNIVVFIYASDFTIFKNSLEHIRRKNTLLVSFCWDDLLYFSGKIKGQPVGIRSLCQQVDFNLTMSPEAIPQYSFRQSPCFFWDSMGLAIFDESINRTSMLSEFYVLFIGSKYGIRAGFVEKLKNRGIEVKCFGLGWENQSLSYEEMIKEIKKAPITLGFANVGYTKNITTIKGRDFEVPLFGGLYLTQYSEGLAHYYSRDEVFSYADFEECLSKIRYIQKNPAEADKVRLAGYLKAKRYATWPSRINYLNSFIKDVVYSN